MQPEMIGDRYQVESAIGQGGMGTVWLCRDERLHRVVAVKQVGLLPGQSVTDSARALREARSSAGLSHPNVVTVYDVVEDSGHIWLVMEHVPGRSLSEVIKQDGPLDPATVADIGAQVADGLTALHAAGTTHRDVKPGNVLIRNDGVAKISDFGIARTTGDQTLTGAGLVTGTPSYFSPALARGVAPTPADDVWALGATLYAAVEGRPPYEAHANPVAVLHDIVTDPPPRPQRADFLEPALQRMLDRDPASRWSMQDAGHVLRRIAETHRSDATVMQTRESTVSPAPVPTPEPPRAAEAAVAQTAPAPASTAAPTPAPTPAPTAAAATQPRDRSGNVQIALVAAVLLLAIAGLVWVAPRLGDDGSNGTPDAGSTSSPKDRQSPADTQSPDDSETTEGTSSSDSEAMEAFVRDYYAAAPGGTDEAWNMLGPSLQEQGRESYDSFWRRIESAEVKSATATPETDTVEITVTYRTTDGRVSTERKREGLVPSDDGGYLLDTDVPAQ